MKRFKLKLKILILSYVFPFPEYAMACDGELLFWRWMYGKKIKVAKIDAYHNTGGYAIIDISELESRSIAMQSRGHIMSDHAFNIALEKSNLI